MILHNRAVGKSESLEGGGQDDWKKLKLKPLQNKKGQKNLGYPRKKQSFSLYKDCFFLRYPKIFWPFLFWSGFTMRRVFVCFLEESMAWQICFRNYLTFITLNVTRCMYLIKKKSMYPLALYFYNYMYYILNRLKVT